MRLAATICLSILVSALAVSASASDRPLKLSYNSDWPPYSSGVGKKVTGILPALMEEILANRLGIAVEHHGAPWARVQHYVETGRMDAFVTVPTDKRLEYAHSSDSIVYRFEMRPIVKRGQKAESMINASPNTETLKSLRICDLLGNGWAKNFYGKHSLEFYAADDAAACLRLINGERLDVIIQPAAIGLKSIREQYRGDQLTSLDHVYGEMNFTLLLSKQTRDFSDLMQRFDETVTAMKADGSYDALIDDLRMNPPEAPQE